MLFHFFARPPAAVTLPSNCVPMARVFCAHPAEEQGAPPGMDGAGYTFDFERRQWVSSWLNGRDDYLQNRAAYVARIACDNLRLSGAESAARPAPALFLRGFGQAYAGPPNFQPTRALHWDAADAVGTGPYRTASLFVRSSIDFWRSWSELMIASIDAERRRQGLRAPGTIILDMETVPSHRNALRIVGSQVGSWPDHLTDARRGLLRVFPRAVSGGTLYDTLDALLARQDVPAVNLAQDWSHTDNLPFSRWWAGVSRSIASDVLDRTLYRTCRRIWPGVQIMQYDHTLSVHPDVRIWQQHEAIGGWNQTYCSESHQGVVAYTWDVLANLWGGSTPEDRMMAQTDAAFSACSPAKPLMPWLMAVGGHTTIPAGWQQTSDVLGQQTEAAIAKGAKEAVIYFDAAEPGVNLDATAFVCSQYAG